MKAILSTAVLLFAAAAPLHSKEDFALRLELYNVVPGKGRVIVGVCPEAKFLKVGCEFQVFSAVTANPHVIEVPKQSLVPGRYAVQVFYDRNLNGELDKNFMGVPKEPVGFSRDAAGRFGPPKFPDAAFNYSGAPLNLRIHLH